jgi:hypothetical protein
LPERQEVGDNYEHRIYLLIQYNFRHFSTLAFHSWDKDKELSTFYYCGLILF